MDITPQSQRSMATGLMNYDSDSSMSISPVDSVMSGLGGYLKTTVSEIVQDTRTGPPGLPFQSGRLPQPMPATAAPVPVYNDYYSRVGYRARDRAYAGTFNSRIYWLKRPKYSLSK